MTTGPIQAGIYCRLSLARDGDTTKVDDQERICRELCAQLRWDVAEVYVDNNQSAWQRNRKRPGWDKMLADVKRGHITAIAVYHGDRLVRHPWDLELLIDLAETRGVLLASPTGTRDLANRDEHFALRIEVAVAKRSSDDTSRRSKMGHERRWRAGIVNTGGRGGRLFGFATDGVTHYPADRCYLPAREEVTEADIVREVYARVLAGEGIRHIASGLRGRGVTTTAGKPIHPIAIRRMLTSPRYAGLMPDGVSAAAWQPVVSREDWETASALISGRAAMLAPGHTARRYLLSGIARCGACGRTMQVLTGYVRASGEKIATRYGCLDPACRKVFRNLEHLDTYVTVRVVAKLNDRRNPPGRIPSAPRLAAELLALAEERAGIEADILDHTKGHRHLLLGRLDSVDKRLAQLRELTAADAAARVTRAHTGITEDEFGALPLSVRRSLVAACFTITVLPASKRGPGFRTEDVVLARPDHGRS